MSTERQKAADNARNAGRAWEVAGMPQEGPAWARMNEARDTYLAMWPSEKEETDKGSEVIQMGPIAGPGPGPRSH